MEQLHADRATDLAFDEREQAEIISLAAALQREHGQRASLTDLERAAMEAGIDPRFVREAVRRRQMSPASSPAPVLVASSRPAEPAWQIPVVLAVFVPVELTLMTVVAHAFRFGIRSVSTEVWACLFGAAVAFGLLLPRRASARKQAAAWPIILTAFLGAIDWGQPAMGFPWRSVVLRCLWIAALQSAVAVGAHLIRENNSAERETVSL